MIHFETYQWEDHVPRRGGWKLNLVVGVLAFGLIAAAMPDDAGDVSSFAAQPANPAIEVRLSVFDAQGGDTPAALPRTAAEAVPCPIEFADS